MSEITQDLITKELVICDAFGELRLKPILFEKNVEYGTNKIIDLLNDLQQENQQLKEDYKVLRATNISLNDLVNSCQQRIREQNSVLNEVREFIKEKYKEDYSENDNYVPIENLNLENCSYERSLQVLAILDKVGDK